MKVFTREEIQALASENHAPHVTLMLPLHPGGDQWKQDPIRLRNLIDAARAELTALNVDPSEIDRMLGPARVLLDDTDHWQRSGAGLAMFLSRRAAHTYRVPSTLPALSRVSDEFHLRPLVRLLQGDGEFFVLAIGKNQVRLLQCTRDVFQQVEIPDAPRNLAEAISTVTQTQENRPQHANRVTTVNTRPGFPMVQGFGHEDRKTYDLMEYYGRIDRALHALLRDERAPLVFAGVEEDFPVFAGVSRYPELMPEAVHGNPELRSDAELHQLAWNIVEPRFQAQRFRDEARFQNLQGTGRTSTDVADVVQAALFGRVETLFFSTDAELFGRVDRDQGLVEIHDTPQPGDVELVNEAAVHALLKGGVVYEIPRDALPEHGNGEAVNALMRW